MSVAEPPKGKTLYRVAMENPQSGDKITRTIVAKNPDDACGLFTDMLVKELELDLETFNEKYRLVGILKES